VLLLALACAAALGLDTLRLQPNERILIIAPHPDDEVLACGGLIQQTLALGDSVRVVYVTSGDGAWPSVTVITGCLFPRRADYIELGRAREEEARSGAEVLGLAPAALCFLGYPDDGLAKLWQEHWLTPYASPHTGATQSPYDSTDRQYRGADVLADLLDVIGSFRPDRVFVPHPADAHPDHWSTALFVETAREVWHRSQTAPFPSVYRYLVHHPPYPLKLTASDGTLSPPDDLAGSEHLWLTLPLVGPDAPWLDTVSQRKADALDCHESQLSPTGKDLSEFLTANELFDTCALDSVAVTEDAPRGPYTWLAGDRVFDTVAVRAQGDSLLVRVALFSEPLSNGSYSLYLHAVSGLKDSITHSSLTVWLLPFFSPSAADTAKPGTVEVAMTDQYGWTFALPKTILGGIGTALYAADAGPWTQRLMSHSAIGRIVY
jgi:LmbE family N-acetylglucosaminyl deacetylase